MKINLMLISYNSLDVAYICTKFGK